jgi:GNAT superfamily N-acetyltransferase
VYSRTAPSDPSPGVDEPEQPLGVLAARPRGAGVVVAQRGDGRDVLQHDRLGVVRADRPACVRHRLAVALERDQVCRRVAEVVRAFERAERSLRAQRAPRRLAYLVGGKGPSNTYIATVALRGDAVVADCIADYFARSACGIIEFLVVAPEARGGGTGAALAAHFEQRMVAAAQARERRSRSCSRR